MITCDPQELWRRTQDPPLHERWDVRFNRIEYLPRDGEAAAQRFTYERRILPGFTVTGYGETMRFLTRYDYEPRWGAVGRVVDRVLLRPALGWGTAWSFDRLRLWLEHEQPPSARCSLRSRTPSRSER